MPIRRSDFFDSIDPDLPCCGLATRCGASNQFALAEIVDPRPTNPIAASRLRERNVEVATDSLGSKYEVNRAAQFIRDKIANDLRSVAGSSWGLDSIVDR